LAKENTRKVSIDVGDSTDR